MHELALTEGIISIVDSQQSEQGFARVLEIRLRVGEYSGVIPECLRDCFPIAAKGTAAENADLVIESVKASFRCLGCGYEGAIERRLARCPRCGGEELKLLTGREFYVDSLKVE